MLQLFKALLQDESGQDLAEYARFRTSSATSVTRCQVRESRLAAAAKQHRSLRMRVRLGNRADPEPPSALVPGTRGGHI